MSYKVSKKCVRNPVIINYEGRNNSGDDCFDLCNYCGKYYDEECFLGELEYCINCWCVMDESKFNFIDDLLYDSNEVNIDDVLKFLKKHYKNYIIRGPQMIIETNIFARIKFALEEDRVHFLLKRELIDDLSKSSKKNLEEYLKYPNNRNPRVDLNLSTIII